MKLRKKNIKKEASSMEFAELTDDMLNNVIGGVDNLAQFGNNRGSLSDSLSNLSSGMNIDPSANNPSGFQLSERMRVQIRSLD